MGEEKEKKQCESDRVDDVSLVLFSSVEYLFENVSFSNRSLDVVYSFPFDEVFAVRVALHGHSAFFKEGKFVIQAKSDRGREGGLWMREMSSWVSPSMGSKVNFFPSYSRPRTRKIVVDSGKCVYFDLNRRSWQRLVYKKQNQNFVAMIWLLISSTWLKYDNLPCLNHDHFRFLKMLRSILKKWVNRRKRFLRRLRPTPWPCRPPHGPRTCCCCSVSPRPWTRPGRPWRRSPSCSSRQRSSGN